MTRAKAKRTIQDLDHYEPWRESSPFRRRLDTQRSSCSGSGPHEKSGSAASCWERWWNWALSQWVYDRWFPASENRLSRTPVFAIPACFRPSRHPVAELPSTELWLPWRLRLVFVIWGFSCATETLNLILTIIKMEKENDKSVWGFDPVEVMIWEILGNERTDIILLRNGAVSVSLLSFFFGPKYLG